MNNNPVEVNWTVKIASPEMFDNIKGIIFDFDGTLYDKSLFPFYLIAANPPDLFRLRQERIIRKYFAGCDYNTPDDYYAAFFDAFGKACSCPPEEIKKWYFDRFIPRMVKVLKKHFKPRPGAKEIFEHFKTFNVPRVAVYSDYPYLLKRMEALGINTGPDIKLYGPESFGAQKPAARPFLIIAENLGLAPREVLVIGDSENTDGIGAFRAGMRFFCLETGRKRHYRLDPDCHPEKEELHGHVMYTGAWEDLFKLLRDFVPASS